jgi:hypothetical protein
MGFQEVPDAAGLKGPTRLEIFELEEDSAAEI